MKEHSSYQHRILVVDDEPDIVLTLKIVLETNGFKIQAFTDPILALGNFAARSYDLALLDIRMPKITGLGLYRHQMTTLTIKSRIRNSFFRLLLPTT
jgi:DNA-binding response OmpR family regulator